MAPISTLNKRDLIGLLMGDNPPEHITLGRGNPEAEVVKREDGTWCLRRLQLDQQSRDQAYAEAEKTEPFFWMPESEWAFLQPGDVLLQAPSAKLLAARLSVFVWEWD